MRKFEVKKFLADTYFIADKETHEWSSGWSYSSNVGLPTVVFWTVMIVVLRYWVFP